MASNSNWIKLNQDNHDKTPPSSSVKRARSRLSRKTVDTSQLNKDSFWSPTNKLSTTPKQITRSKVREISSASPSTSKHDWYLSQDPSREIIWDYRPLSPLNKSSNVNDKEDLMTNLCKTWKKDGKAASPLGSDALLKQWTKPKEIPDEAVQSIRPRTRFREDTSRTLDPHKAVDRFTKELRRINKMILQSKSHEEIDEAVIDEHPQPNLSKFESQKPKSLIITKDNLLNEVILARDSCEGSDTDTDDDLWGNADDSFNRQLSEIEFCVASIKPSIIPSTLSSDEEKIEISPLKDIVNFKTLSEVNLADVVDKVSGITWKNVHNNQTKHELSSKTLCVKENLEKETEMIDDFSDLFNDDDDFCLSQEVESILDQKTEEVSCSQKRRATVADIERKRDEALKRRESKMKKSNSFASASTMTSFPPILSFLFINDVFPPS